MSVIWYMLHCSSSKIYMTWMDVLIVTAHQMSVVNVLMRRLLWKNRIGNGRLSNWYYMYCRSMQCSVIEILSFVTTVAAKKRHNCTPSLARTVVKALTSCHITPILRSLHRLRITVRIEYKLLSLTYKLITTIQPLYLHNLIFVQRPRSTRSLSIVTLARPPSSSSLKQLITPSNASPCL